jgi:hypothetical protein
MKVEINRQLAGLEDLLWGEGTVNQTRNGETVAVTKINAANLPFDETRTLLEALEDAQPIIDAAAEAIASAAAAATSEGNAATSEANAAGSADAAAASENSAQLLAWEAEAEKLTADSYATEAVGVPVKQYTSNGDGTFTATDVVPTVYSALHYIDSSESSAEAAALSESNAANSESAAAGSASAASNSADAAALSASNASLYASQTEGFRDESAASAAAASTSEGNALASANAAALSETNAADSEASAASWFNQFQDIYLGPFEDAPIVDNDGDPLQEGMIYWHTVQKQLFVWNDTAEIWEAAYFSGSGDIVTLNDEQELYNKKLDDISNEIGADHIHFKVRNTSGDDISVGTLVIGTGTQTGTDYIEIEPQSSQTQISIGITHKLLHDNDVGVAVNTGVVAHVDTHLWPINTILYPDGAGWLTDTKPTVGFYQACAYVLKQDATDGSIMVEFSEPVFIASTTQEGYVQLVDNLTTDDSTKALTPAQGRILKDVQDSHGNDILALQTINADTQEPTGFINRTDSEISFDDVNRRLTISPAVTSYSVYIEGIKQEISTSKTIDITDVEGLHFIYLSPEGTLGEVVNDWDSEVLLRENAYIAVVYWDATSSKHIYFGDERHGTVMDWATHEHFHTAWGAQYITGLGLSDITLGDGSLNSHLQCSVDSGLIRDEDLAHYIVDDDPQNLYPAVYLPLYYRYGAAGDWRRIDSTGLLATPAGSGRAAYNQWTGSTWQLAEVTNTKFLLTHIYATNDTENPIVGIIGQNDCASITEARDCAHNEIGQVIDLLFEELVPIATVIIQTSDSYDNDVHARIVPDEDYNPYVDWRTVQISPSTPLGDHNVLSGRSDPNAHPASAIGFNNTASGLTAETAQAAIDEVEDRLDTAENKLSGIEENAKDDQVASEVPVTPAGNISSEDVQAALEELDSEKQETLVSGTNIKTINSQSLLGSGNIDIESGDPFTTTTVKTTNYDASAGDRILVDTTSGAFIVTLPASPSEDDAVIIVDVGYDLETYNLTVARNGSTIMGLAEDMTVSDSYLAFELRYLNSSWRIV